MFSETPCQNGKYPSSLYKATRENRINLIQWLDGNTQVSFLRFFSNFNENKIKIMHDIRDSINILYMFTRLKGDYLL